MIGVDGGKMPRLPPRTPPLLDLVMPERPCRSFAQLNPTLLTEGVRGRGSGVRAEIKGKELFATKV